MPRMMTSYKDRGKVMYTLLTLGEGDSQAGDGDEDARITYKVRGLSAIEAAEHLAITEYLEPPTPPKKKQARAADEIVDAITQHTSGR